MRTADGVCRLARRLLGWLEAEITSDALLREIREGSACISTLVKAVKDYTYMDQAPLQEADIRAGLDNTLVVLNRVSKYFSQHYRGQRRHATTSAARAVEDLYCISTCAASLKIMFAHAARWLQ